jgi:hypothetical protein
VEENYNGAHFDITIDGQRYHSIEPVGISFVTEDGEEEFLFVERACQVDVSDC